MGIMGKTVCCTIDYYSSGESGNSAPVQADNCDNLGVERNRNRLQSQTFPICLSRTKIGDSVVLNLESFGRILNIIYFFKFA